MPQWVANQSEFTLDCVTGGLPSATILWELNGLVLNLSSVGVNLHENGSLTITEASAETVGLFACVAENGVGISQSLVQVDILATEEIMEGVLYVISLRHLFLRRKSSVVKFQVHITLG